MTLYIYMPSLKTILGVFVRSAPLYTHILMIIYITAVFESFSRFNFCSLLHKFFWWFLYFCIFTDARIWIDRHTLGYLIWISNLCKLIWNVLCQIIQIDKEGCMFEHNCMLIRIQAMQRMSWQCIYKELRALFVRNLLNSLYIYVNTCTLHFFIHKLEFIQNINLSVDCSNILDTK